MEVKMKVLVVYAHPNPKSFNRAVLDGFAKGLTDGGHTFEVDDLYAAKFDPAFKPEDFAQFVKRPMPQDVLEQQAKVAQADALAFVYPVWWASAPAIIKGWFDRVLSYGFAYKIGRGLLNHKKALIISTTMQPEAFYKAGVEDAMKRINKANFDVCGIQNFEQILLYGAAADAEARKRHLQLVERLGKEF